MKVTFLYLYIKKKPYSFALEEYSNALADTLVKILIFNKCRPVEFRNMSRKEVENAKEEKSLSGNKYMVINPAFHKTSRAGTQEALLLFCLGLRSALVFTEEHFKQIKKMVKIGEEISPSSSHALLTFSGSPLGVQTCHKMWLQMFLKAG